MNYDEQQIDDYLLQRLSVADRRVFEGALATDEKLREETKMREFMIGAIQAFGEMELRDKLKTIHHEEVDSKNKTDFRKYWVLLLLAVVFAIAGIYFWQQHAAAKQTPEQIFAAYYQPAKITFTDRSVVASDSLAMVEDAYFKKDYQKAIPTLRLLTESHPESDKLKLALGVCLMETGNDEDALRVLKYLIGNTLYSDQALWYSALISLRKGDNVTAKSMLTDLAKDNDSNLKRKADELLSTLTPE